MYYYKWPNIEKSTSRLVTLTPSDSRNRAWLCRINAQKING